MRHRIRRSTQLLAKAPKRDIFPRCSTYMRLHMRLLAVYANAHNCMLLQYKSSLTRIASAFPSFAEPRSGCMLPEHGGIQRNSACFPMDPPINPPVPTDGRAHKRDLDFAHLKAQRPRAREGRPPRNAPIQQSYSGAFANKPMIHPEKFLTSSDKSGPVDRGKLR